MQSIIGLELKSPSYRISIILNIIKSNLKNYRRLNRQKSSAVSSSPSLQALVKCWLISLAFNRSHNDIDRRSWCAKFTQYPLHAMSNQETRMSGHFTNQFEGCTDGWAAFNYSRDTPCPSATLDCFGIDLGCRFMLSVEICQTKFGSRSK